MNQAAVMYAGTPVEPCLHRRARIDSAANCLRCLDCNATKTDFDFWGKWMSEAGSDVTPPAELMPKRCEHAKKYYNAALDADECRCGAFYKIQIGYWVNLRGERL